MCKNPLYGYVSPGDPSKQFHPLTTASGDGPFYMYRARIDPDTGEYLGALRLPEGKYTESEFRDWCLRNAVLPQIVNCGKCPECKLNYARSWSLRIMHECSMHEKNCFITLTYDDVVLHGEDPPNPNPLKMVAQKDGKSMIIRPLLSLERKNLTDWLKRLRISLDRKCPGTKILVYYCGEYGDTTLRPHYHVAVMGWCPDDGYFWRKSEKGNPVYRSAFLESTWRFGEINYGELNADSAAYVARYTLKKAHGKTVEWYKQRGLSKEFVGMSTRPAIGLNYLRENREALMSGSDMLTLPSIAGRGIRTCPMPRYYLDKLDKYEPGWSDEIREARKARGKILESLPHDTDLDRDDYRHMVLTEQIQKKDTRD